MTTRFPDAGPVLAATATVAGALAGERLGPAPGLGSALAAGLALGATLAFALGSRNRLAVALGLLGLGLLAATSMQRALDGLGGPVVRLAGRGEMVVVAARLADDPRAQRGHVRVPARLDAFRTVTGTAARPSRTRVLVVARHPTAMRLRLLGAGETAMVSGRLRPLETVDDAWRWRHVAAVLDADDLLAVRPARIRLLRAANGLRALVLRGSDPLPPDRRALVAGFLVGDDRDLPPPLSADFRAAGLSHLLVVSGANVALALTLAGPALRRLGLLGRLAGGVAVLGLFAAMTRFEPSVLRACAMAGLSLLAAFLGRPASGVRLLALATSGLILADPFLVHSVGFRLSCGATAGIALLAGPLAGRLPGPEFARRSLAVTTAAQIGVAPVALPLFGGLPLVALPANLAAAPAAAALTVWGLGSGLAGGLVAGWWPGVAELLQVPTGVLAGSIAGVAALAARIPVAVTPGPVTVAAVVAAAYAVRCGRWSGWWRRPAHRPAVPTAAAGRGRTAPGR